MLLGASDMLVSSEGVAVGSSVMSVGAAVGVGSAVGAAPLSEVAFAAGSVVSGSVGRMSSAVVASSTRVGVAPSDKMVSCSKMSAMSERGNGARLGSLLYKLSQEERWRR